MEANEIIKTWYYGLTKTDKTIKKMTRRRLTFKDGATSLVLLSLIASILLGVFLSALSVLTPELGITEALQLTALTFVATSVGGIITLAIVTWAFRKIADRYEGKGKFAKEAGFFGIFAGMYVLAMIPYLIGYVAMLLLIAVPMISFAMMGLGLLITIAYTGKLMGMLFEVLMEMEKTTASNIGWFQGVTGGVLYFIFLLLIGILSQITGVIVPLV